MSLKLSNVGSKTKSLGQTPKKPCEHSRGHIVGAIFTKLGKNVNLHKCSDEFENGSYWVKKQVKSQKKNFEDLRGHFFDPICSELGQNVCLHESLDELKTG